jgi:hypothetical protein
MYRVAVFNLFLIIISIEMNLFLGYITTTSLNSISLCTPPSYDVCSTKDTISL